MSKTTETNKAATYASNRETSMEVMKNKNIKDDSKVNQKGNTKY